MIMYPKKLQMIFDKLVTNGIKPIIVGGFVRDKILNRDSNDIDIELYNILSLDFLEELLKMYGDVNRVGKSFGVIKLSYGEYQIDFTLPRTDNKVASGHKGFETFIDANMDFRSAARRRDFTINAIGYDIKNKKILDPFNGQKDIQNRTLKAVHVKSFIEDPLRVLRAAVFCSRFDFKMDNELFNLCKDMSDKKLLLELPKERIYAEIKKILLQSKNPSIGFQYIKEVNALEFLYPLNILNNKDYKALILSLDYMAKYKTEIEKDNLLLMLAILSSKFDKNQTQAFISHLTNEKKLVENILKLTQTNFKTVYTESELLFLATKVTIHLFILYNKAIHYTIHNSIFEKILKRANKLGVLYQKKEPFIKGKDIIDLGIKPSKEYSKILNTLYNKQLKMEIKTKDEAIRYLKKLIF